MHHILVVETAHHVDDGIHVADVAQELVAESFSRTGAFDQAGNVDEFNGGGLDLLRLDDGGEPIHAGIGHLDDSHIGIDGAEGVVGRFGAAEVSALKMVDLPTWEARQCRS